VTGDDQLDEASQEDLNEVIDAMMEMLAAGRPGQDPDPELATALGLSLADRYRLQGADSDREAAITWLGRVCGAAAAPGHAPMAELSLAMLLIERGEERRDEADIGAALGYGMRCQASLGTDLIPLGRYLLGVGHLVRAELSQQPAEFPVAIGYLREAAALLPKGSPERTEVEARLGTALARWVLAGAAAGDAAAGDAAALDEAVALLAGTQRCLPPSDAYLGQVRYWLAAAHSLRFMGYAGSPADLAEALAGFEAILADPAVATPVANLCHTFSACLLLFRTAPEQVRRASAMLDTGQLAQFFAQPPERITPDDAKAALAHLDLVSASAGSDELVPIGLWLRGAATAAALGGDGGQDGGQASAEQLAPAVAGLEAALRRLPEGDPAAGELHGMLGLLYGVQERSAAASTGPGRAGADPAGSSAGPGRSVESLVAAAQQLGDGHPMLPLVHSMLGGAFGLPPGDRSPSPEESTAAIELLESILDRIPDDHPARAQALLHLGAILIGRSARLDHAVPHLAKLRRRLDELVAGPAVSQPNLAVNTFLLGMAEGIEGLLAPDADLISAALDRFKRAAELASGEPQIQGYVRIGLISLLCQRYALGGSLEYLDAALYYAQETAQAAQNAESNDPFLLTAEYLLAAGPAMRDPDGLDRDRLEQVISKMEAVQARIPAGHRLRPVIGTDVNLLQVLRGGMGIMDRNAAAGWRAPGRIAEATAAADDALAQARATPVDDPFFPLNLGTAGNARMLHGFLLRDPRTLSQGIALLAEAADAARAVPEFRQQLLSMLGAALRMRYELTRDRNDLNSMLSRLADARRLADAHRSAAGLAGLLYMCALGYYERNDQNLRDRSRAVQLGLSALQERAATVLLQSTTDRAFDAALAAGGEAADVARWCLADGNLEAAVEALERGRGMVLHTAVADGNVPFLLRQAGHQDLAAEWETALAETRPASPGPWDLLPDVTASLHAPAGLAGPGPAAAEVRLPDDLRYRVIRALEGTQLERLLAPPSPGEIVQALLATGARALVYLLPREGLEPGLALVVDDAGRIRRLPLPALTAGPRGPVADFARAQRELHGTQRAASGQPDSAADARSRRRRLDALCDWAWTAAMERVLDELGGSTGHRPRIVLVPVGDLSLVPWHAARRTVAGGEVRYVCQDAVVSYAASARQFTESCRNGRRPWRSAAALVRVSRSRLFFASQEVQGIHQAYYPDAVLLGGPDPRLPPATAENVRGLLARPGAAGASLLHLGCHAQPAPRPVAGRLLLGSGEELSMRDILRQSRGRPPDTPGCLVVLAACGSDLSSGHHDEALTLATSFLAAGAVGAVGTRWPVDDLATMAFMIMFHHYLNSGYDDPATALRAAQCWMLDPGRSFGPAFQPKIAKMLQTIDLTRAEVWAAFTYQGQ